MSVWFDPLLNELWIFDEEKMECITQVCTGISIHAKVEKTMEKESDLIYIGEFE